MATTYNVTPRTLRFYEQEGLLAPRRKGTYRYYTARDRVRLQIIVKGRRLGFTLSEVKKLLEKVAGKHTAPSDFFELIDVASVGKRIEALCKKRDDTQLAIDQLRAALGSS